MRHKRVRRYAGFVAATSRPGRHIGCPALLIAALLSASGCTKTKVDKEDPGPSDETVRAEALEAGNKAYAAAKAYWEVADDYEGESRKDRRRYAIESARARGAKAGLARAKDPATRLHNLSESLKGTSRAALHGQSAPLNRAHARGARRLARTKFDEAFSKAGAKKRHRDALWKASAEGYVRPAECDCPDSLTSWEDYLKAAVDRKFVQASLRRLSPLASD